MNKLLNVSKSELRSKLRDHVELNFKADEISDMENDNILSINQVIDIIEDIERMKELVILREKEIQNEKELEFIKNAKAERRSHISDVLKRSDFRFDTVENYDKELRKTGTHGTRREQCEFCKSFLRGRFVWVGMSQSNNKIYGQYNDKNENATQGYFPVGVGCFNKLLKRGNW